MGRWQDFGGGADGRHATETLASDAARAATTVAAPAWKPTDVTGQGSAECGAEASADGQVARLWWWR